MSLWRPQKGIQMLLTVSAENYKSFLNLGHINLTAKPSEKSIPGAAVPVVLKGTPADAVLTAAAIYGPNASGKTNFLLAIRAMRIAIVDSQTDWTPDQSIPIEPHVCATSKETKLEVEFLVDEVRYRYGFQCTTEFFSKEWLYSYPTGRERLLFERRTKNQGGELQTEVDFGNHLSGQKRDLESIGRRTRPNSLFVSSGTQDNQAECKIVFGYFKNRVKFVSADTSDAVTAVTSMVTHDITGFKKLLLPLMQLADSSIMDVTTERSGDDDSDLSTFEDDEKLYRHIKKYKAAFRIGDADKNFPIAFDYESRGVKRLYAISFMVISALGSGLTLVIDELETSMHAHVASQLLALFQNPASNPLGAQLIFTTHETRLLNLEHLRRDQIWFCEREGMNSELYSLLEFAPRKDQNFEAGYLRGRYGAIPRAAISPAWLQSIREYSEKYGHIFNVQ